MMKRLPVLLFFLAFISYAHAQQFYTETAAAKHWVDSVYNSLSKEQRIAQLMVVRLSAKTQDSWQFFD